MPTARDQNVLSPLKQVRDLMRMDKGLSGEVDRLPTLTWLLLLRLVDRPGQEALQAPYRWRDWANTEALTSEELLAFICASDAKRPDGSWGPGLLRHVATLPEDTPDTRILRECFTDVECKLRSGSLLVRIAAQLSKLPVTSSRDIHTLGNVYESLLQEMRDAAGDSGEFYTPRPLTRTLIDVLDPRPGESVLDPACGTGGFLVEIPTRSDRLAQPAPASPGRIVGWEAKQLPHLLARMNLFLHGRPDATIEVRNSLELDSLSDLEVDGFDVIATNPPFGGREEASIAARFPKGRRTTETALLFLQLIVAALNDGGRAAVVLPNGSLFGAGVATRVRADLMDTCRLDAVLRLPRGCFAPYTTIPTNVLFFTKGIPTQSVWFYEIQLSNGRTQFTKTDPVRYNHFDEFRKWWPEPHDTNHSWKVKRATIEADDYNLDIRNPRLLTAPAAEDLGTIVEDLLGMGRDLVSQLEVVDSHLEEIGR
jgi:type I restriction enzyme M protein